MDNSGNQKTGACYDARRITVKDTSAESQNTLHGKLDFIQLVGITEEELDAIRKDTNNINVLIELMKKDNPELVTDMSRTSSYL